MKIYILKIILHHHKLLMVTIEIVVHLFQNLNAKLKFDFLLFYDVLLLFVHSKKKEIFSFLFQFVMIPLKDDHVAFHYDNIWLNDKQDNHAVFRILFHNHVCCDIVICPIYKKTLSICQFVIQIVQVSCTYSKTY